MKGLSFNPILQNTLSSFNWYFTLFSPPHLIPCARWGRWVSRFNRHYPFYKRLSYFNFPCKVIIELLLSRPSNLSMTLVLPLFNKMKAKKHKSLLASDIIKMYIFSLCSKYLGQSFQNPSNFLSDNCEEHLFFFLMNPFQLYLSLCSWGGLLAGP